MDDKPEFLDTFVVPHQGRNNGALAARLLVSRMMIRHTKAMSVGGQAVLTLPPKREVTVRVDLSPAERLTYAHVEAEMRSRWRLLAAGGPAVVAKNVLLAMSLLEPLRRLCSGGEVAVKDMAARMGQSQSRQALGAPPSLPSLEACLACDELSDVLVAAPCCGQFACYGCLSAAAEGPAQCCLCAAQLRPEALPPPPSGFFFDPEEGSQEGAGDSMQVRPELVLQDSSAVSGFEPGMGPLSPAPTRGADLHTGCGRRGERVAGGGCVGHNGVQAQRAAQRTDGPAN